jgi:hypothetical protein
MFFVGTALGLVTSVTLAQEQQKAEIAQLDNQMLDEPILLAQVTDPPADETGTTVEAETCESLSFKSYFSLGWIACPVVSFLGKMVKGIFEWVLGKNATGEYCNLVLNFDETLPDEAESTCTSSFNTNSLQRTWNYFRVIANAFFAIAFLYAIYEIAFSSGNNAYSIRKMLPRLGLAVILVQLSFFLSKYFLGLINDIGSGIDAIFNGVLPTGGDVGAILWGADDSFIDTVVTGTVATGAIGAAWIAGLISFGAILMSLALVLITVFVVLIVRKLLLLVLIIVAPIAAIAWIHKETDGFSKAWWQLFSKIALMYPLIILLLRTGELMAYAVSDPSTDSGGVLSNATFDIVRFIAYFAPYFLIPFTFKFAGGLIGQVAGTADRMRGGMVSNLQKKTQEKAAERRQRWAYGAKSGGLFRNTKEGGFRDRANRGIGRLTTGSFIPGRIGDRREASAGQQDVQQSMQMFKELQEAGVTNIDALKVLKANRVNYDQMKEAADQFETEGNMDAALSMRSAMQFDKRRELGAAAGLVLASFGKATDKDFEDFNKTVTNPTSRARIVNQAQYLAKSQGNRFDQGPGTILLNKEGRVDVSSPEGEARVVTNRDQAVIKLKPYEFARMPAEGLANLKPSIERVINGEVVGISPEQRQAVIEGLAQASFSSDARSRGIQQEILGNLRGAITINQDTGLPATRMGINQPPVNIQTRDNGQRFVSIPGVGPNPTKEVEIVSSDTIRGNNVNVGGQNYEISSRSDGTRYYTMPDATGQPKEVDIMLTAKEQTPSGTVEVIQGTPAGDYVTISKQAAGRGGPRSVFGAETPGDDLAIMSQQSSRAQGERRRAQPQNIEQSETVSIRQPSTPPPPNEIPGQQQFGGVVESSPPRQQPPAPEIPPPQPQFGGQAPGETISLETSQNDTNDSNQDNPEN